MNLEHFLTPYTKINSTWIKDVNVRPETIKLLEENIGKTLSNINHSRILYDLPPRILEIKAKVNKVKRKESEVAQLCLTLCDPMDSSLHQAPPSMGFSRQEYWSGLPFPSPGNLPNPGIEPRSLTL